MKRSWQHYAAPAAFLLAATIAVVLIRAGFESSGTAPPPSVAATTGKSAPRYWTVRAGDTYAVIARATGVSVVVIRRLNPGVSSTSLFIGQRVRVR
ncbi:MAG TPA: LysM domain-containing protein [Gaiellaceae bacterium]|nr:LysM domain-containing protein [Gaiellaceae bacterium]